MRSNRAEIQRLARLSYFVRNRCCCLAKIGRTAMWRSMTTGQRSCPAGRITGILKQAVSGKACAGCMKEFCRITAASAGLMSKLSMAGYKVAGRSQKQPVPSGRKYTKLCVWASGAVHLVTGEVRIRLPTAKHPEPS